jgi:hypothetical protein
MNRRNWISALAATALAVCATVACERDPQPKERPHDVPLMAVWSGGRDGGAYFDCSAGGSANECTVWDDGTGAVKMTGKFLLVKEKRAAYTTELQFVSASDDEIFLANGLVLRKVP